jgi:hypothetical protein
MWGDQSRQAQALAVIVFIVALIVCVVLMMIVTAVLKISPKIDQIKANIPIIIAPLTSLMT